MKFLILAKTETDHREILKFSESETRISAGMGEINSRVPVISMTHLPRFTPLYRAAGGTLVAPGHPVVANPLRHKRGSTEEYTAGISA